MEPLDLRSFCPTPGMLGNGLNNRVPLPKLNTVQHGAQHDEQGTDQVLAIPFLPVQLLFLVGQLNWLDIHPPIVGPIQVEDGHRDLAHCCVPRYNASVIDIDIYYVFLPQ